MLKGSGFDYSRPERLDIAHCKDLPVSIVFLPASDIATYVAEGNVDLGITGEDMIAESGATVNVLMKLGFGKCRLSVQAPKGQCEDVRKLAGSRIATSFPELAKKFFGQYENGTPTSIKVISGSVEASCGLGLSDGIVDLVETGTTMRAAGLEEVAVLMNTQAVLISNSKTAYPELVETVRRRLAGYQTAQRFFMCTYNVHRDNLNEVRAHPPAAPPPPPSPPRRRRRRRRRAAASPAPHRHCATRPATASPAPPRRPPVRPAHTEGRSRLTSGAPQTRVTVAPPLSPARLTVAPAAHRRAASRPASARRRS